MVDFDSLVADPAPSASPAPNENPTQLQHRDPSAVPFDQLQDDSEKYGTGTEQFKTTLEQLASGATLGASKVLETQGIPALGIPAITTPEAVAGREAANPITSTVSNIAGTAGLLGVTGGLGGIAEGAGVAARLGAGVLEGAGIGGISTATDDWSQNKPLDAQKIMASAGLGALIGGAGSGIAEGIRYKFGTPLAKSANSAIDEVSQSPAGKQTPVISQLDAAPYQDGDFKTVVSHSTAIPKEDAPKIINGLRDQKQNAAEITQAASDIGAPVLEGMTSSNPWVQKAEDLLVNGAPTYSGINRQKAYQQVFDAIKNTTDAAIGEGSPYTKADLGSLFKNSITDQIDQQVKPINELYNSIKPYYSVIPLVQDAADALSDGLENIQELRIAPNSPEGRLVNQVINDIPNLKTVDDIKSYKSILNRSISPTASSGEKRMAGIISDQLSSLEEHSVTQFAENLKNQYPKNFNSVNPEEFITQLNKNKRSSFLTPYKPEDIKNYQLFKTPENAGYALTPEKDLVSVFNNSGTKGAGREAVKDAIKNGAKTLDAFDDFLPDYYNKFGFVEKSRVPWDDQYAPKGWDYEKQGRPDVVFMEFPENLSRDPAATQARYDLATTERSNIRGGVGRSETAPGIRDQHGLFDWKTWGGVGSEPSTLPAQSMESGHGLNPNKIDELLTIRKVADASYKRFKKDLNTLADQLGKGKVYGAQDAIDFIHNRVTPEDLVQKLFSKNDSDFLKFFSNKFPRQMELMKQYQKQVLRDSASKTGELNSNTVFREINKLQPEIQKSIFNPDELQKLKSAQIVQQSIPKSVNPSGTSHALAFRSFVEHPTGTLIATARDAALSTYIKNAGGPILGSTTKALQNHLGVTSNRIEKGVKLLFSASASQARKAP